MLKSDDQEVRRTALHALGQLGPRAKAAVPAVLAGLHHRNWELRSAAALTLGQIGPGAKPAVGQLTAALADMEGDVRVSAIEALGRIGPDAQAATAGLVERLRRRAPRSVPRRSRAAGAHRCRRKAAAPELEKLQQPGRLRAAGSRRGPGGDCKRCGG